MGLADDLRKEADGIFLGTWDTRDGYVVPADNSLKLTNDGVKIQAAVLYADLAESTELVDKKTATFSAEVYKAFLKSACKVITSMEGTITAFDGDRVMAVFIGDMKNSNAVKAGLKINWVVKNILNPSLKGVYKDSDFVINHGVGIDSSELLVAKTGIRGSNDLVWVGPAANYAAKLATIRTDGYSTWISQRVFDKMDKEAKYSNGTLMWEPRTWNTYNQTIHRSNYWWSL